MNKDFIKFRDHLKSIDIGDNYVKKNYFSYKPGEPPYTKYIYQNYDKKGILGYYRLIYSGIIKGTCHPKWRSVLPDIYEYNAEIVSNELANQNIHCSNIDYVYEMDSQTGTISIIVPAYNPECLYLRKRGGLSDIENFEILQCATKDSRNKTIHCVQGIYTKDFCHHLGSYEPFKESMLHGEFSTLYPSFSFNIIFMDPTVPMYKYTFNTKNMDKLVKTVAFDKLLDAIIWYNLFDSHYNVGKLYNSEWDEYLKDKDSNQALEHLEKVYRYCNECNVELAKYVNTLAREGHNCTIKNRYINKGFSCEKEKNFYLGLLPSDFIENGLRDIRVSRATIIKQSEELGGYGHKVGLL